MAKFCSECGKEVNEKAIVCTGCGCPLERYDSAPQQQQPMYVRTVPFNGHSVTGFILSFLPIIPSIFSIKGVPSAEDIAFPALIAALLSAVSLFIAKIGLQKIKAKHNLRGKGLAIAGIVISVALMLWNCVMIFAAFAW